MSEGARPGWYQDPQGPADVLRYWDGERWTEHRHRHPATAEPATDSTRAEPDAADPATAGRGDEDSRPTEPVPVVAAPKDNVATGGILQGIAVGLIIAVLALLLIAVTIGLPGSGEDSESSDAPSLSSPSQREPNAAGSTDGSPQELARSAQSAIEIYANDNGGSYDGASPEDLAEIEPGLEASQIAVSSNKTAFTVTAISGEAAFSISRAGNGTVTLSCEPPGRSGCPANGDWS